ncbi:rho GTPase-activating protein gacF-like isoform X3 [Cataglyphis hispanica]|uniref:rho GTPase-activating protein gacF-like isoform X3 n=1 Tax=Cataglyphis hispanica TaxID=1086592 RepID=UPI00218045E3|nr:rho GTPase-activating protein gacF-like isoform X3 [Cataglyphis hispanica]
MIPYTTCLSFGGRRDVRGWVVLYDEVSFYSRRTTEIAMDKEEMFVRIFDSNLYRDSGTSVTLSKDHDESAREVAFRRLSDTDRILLENLDIDRCRSRQTGRFLTIHKRRRKKLITRSLSQEPGILDDIFHGLVQCVLQRAGNWRFNAFTLETVTGGRSLPVLCVHLFHWYGLLQYFTLDVVTVWKLFAFIEEGYHSTNPYHNSVHATDVTQAMHCFLQEEKIKPHLTSLEIMASLIAAVTHDLDHPGVNQPFLVATSNHLAALYQNTSVLENHHWRSAIGCLLDSGVSAELPADVRSELQRHISSLILATDITRQQEFLTRFRDYLNNNSLDMKRAEDRHFILQIALKCADISNPCRPWDISRKWSYKVCEEFFRQGDYERRLNLPVTPLCDRHTTSIPKIQTGFFKHVVTPLYVEWHRFLGDGLSVSLMEYLKTNQKKWEALINQEIEQTETEISELDEPEGAISSGEETAANDDSGSIDLLIPAAYAQTARMPTLPGRVGLDRVGRRHSVPLSISKPLSVPLRQTPRRESLPSEQIKAKNSLQKLENQSLLEPSSLSLLSSKSSIAESSNVSAERPVSAEDLLPETSIASITSSTEASKLNTVLQSDDQLNAQIKQLTRQQTFPPLQSYTRTRYMSTTAEMSQCYTQILIEADSSSSCSTPTKNKSCSSGRCCSPLSLYDPDTCYQEKSDTLKVSQKLLMVDTKRRGSTLSNTIKQKHVLSSERRHSMQTVRTDDSFSKHRRKRSSSAQDSDPTQVFYVTLTGSHGDKNNVSDMSTVKSKLNLDCNVKRNRHSAKSTVQELRTTLSSKKLDQCTSSTKSSYFDQEPRRYSTPITEYRTMIDHAGRRYTTIPVSSEFSTHKVFFIGSPPDSPPRNHSVSSSSDSSGEPKKNMDDSSNEAVIVGSKRELDCTKEKNSKIMKLSSDAQMKENVDPRTNDDFAKTLAMSRRGSQGWARRRGSAPVGLLSKLDDSNPITIPTRIDHSCRRGSVPTDITKHQGCNRLALGPRENNFLALRRASLPQEIALENLSENISILTSERENFSINNNNNNNNSTNNSNNNGISKLFDSSVSGMFSPRRGSVPADISELRHDMFSRNSVNSKSRSRKKILKRRSSGGPEMFTGQSTDGNDNGIWLKWKREIGKHDPVPEALVKRRGSLPIEMVAVSHAGSTSAPHRSSLWRL